MPDKPGLGFDGINEDYLREHIDPERPGIFEPTETWDTDRSNDRLWS